MPDELIDCTLGVDGGGSKTLAVLVDAQGRELSRGKAGSSNYQSVGLPQAVESLQAAIIEAARIAGCALPLRAAWMGLAGVDRAADLGVLLPYLRAFAGYVYLTNDAELLLSGLDNRVGVALIAGTGSIALGRDLQGVVKRTGGWGHILGDEGSGYDIGRQALQAAVRSADGRGKPTALLELILRYWQLAAASDIIGQVYRAEDKAVIAQLAPLVLAAALSGDDEASRIVQAAADELALAVTTLSSSLAWPDERVPIALGGGLLVHEADFRDRVLHSVQRLRPTGQVAIIGDPALSAALAARHLPA